MRFTKPPLSYEQQADLLIARGLKADREKLIQRLERVNYYRLSAYWYPYRLPGSDDLQPDTDFEMIWEHYIFDRQLRVLVMDAIERVEVAIKTQLANYLALHFGSFSHLDRANLPKLRFDQHRRMLGKIQKSEDRSQEPFVIHYHQKYTSETNMPVWMAVEAMDFGTVLTLYRGCDQYTKRAIATPFGLSARILESWLLTLNYVRNICAHHARLWNRVLSVPPGLPNRSNQPDFHLPVSIPTNRTFTILTILQFLLKHIAPQSAWASRLECLWSEKHPNIPISRMGFPANWKECPIWKAPSSPSTGEAK